MKRIPPLAVLVFATFSLFAQAWNQYPYTPSGSFLTFPADEGWHTQEPIEWWYMNAHVTGQTTGHPYSVMMTFFAYDSLFFDGFRILNIADDSTGEFHTGTAFVKYPLLATDHLEIKAQKLPFGGNEHWYTRKDANDQWLPFSYEIYSSGSPGTIQLTLDAFKPPLIVADSGYLNQGLSNYTYYYSQTGMDVSGQITFNGITEDVSGTGWIDRQYGNFNPNTGEAYEWFSLQLSNGMDFNLWNIFTEQNTIPANDRYRILAMYIDENTSQTISEFELTRLKYAYTTNTHNCYANQWRLTSDSLDIDLIISLSNKDHEVLIPFAFMEGSTIITGTVQGQPVTGVGFAELLHKYEVPALSWTAPVSQDTWNISVPIQWQLLNPDEGRPVYYDLYASYDGDFFKIGEHLADTSFLWDASGFPQGEAYRFKCVAYSQDHTLTDSIITDQAYYLNPSGTQEALAQKITLSPNPAQNLLHVDCDCAGRVSFINSQGQRLPLQRRKVKGQDLYIDISTLAPGVYTLEIRNDSGAWTQKWIKSE